MKFDPLKAIMLGGGRNSAVGMAHVSAMRLSDAIDLVAGKWSKDSSESKQSAMYYGLNEDASWSMEEVEANSNDALVVVALPPTELSGNLERILAKARCVFQEKPVAISSTMFRKFMELRRDRPWFFNYTYLGFPMVRRMREIVEAGKLGNLVRLEVEMPQETFLRSDAKIQSWRERDYSIPTISLDLGVHVLSLAHYVLDGFEITDMSSMKSGLQARKGLVSAVDVIGRASGQLDFVLAWSKYCLGMRNGLSVTIFGDKGSIKWIEERPDQLYHYGNRGETSVIRRSSPNAGVADLQKYNRFKAGHPTGYIEALANLYNDVGDSVLQGDTPACISPETSLEIMEQLEAIDESTQ